MFAAVPAAFLAFMGFVGALVGEDLAVNPRSPVQIFAVQFEQSFGYAPGANLPAVTPVRPIKKRVFVTRPHYQP